jgi:hypothetical protein
MRWTAERVAQRISVAVAIVVAVVLLATLPYLAFRGPDASHFGGSPPPGTRLLNYEKKLAGFGDVNYKFEFHTPDDRLFEKLIQEWDLEKATDDVSGTFSQPDWWPDEDYLEDLPVYYERDDRAEERYRRLWYDPARQRLYFEYGRW